MQFLQPSTVRAKFVCLGAHMDCFDVETFKKDPEKKYEGVEIVNPGFVAKGEIMQALRSHAEKCEDCIKGLDPVPDDLEWSFHGSSQVRRVGQDMIGHEMLEAIRDVADPKESEEDSNSEDSDGSEISQADD